MTIFKVTNETDGKVYVGYSINDNPNNLGAGKYIKRAVKDFGTKAFNREVLDVFDNDESLSDVLKRVEYWINKFKSDNPKYGFNETVQELIPQKKRLTKKLKPAKKTFWADEKIKDFTESSEPPEVNCVRILTIHSAKGLESEAVILAQSYRNNSNLDKIFPIFSQDFSCKDLIYNPKIFRNNIFIDSNFKSFEIKNLSENRNLLYVACTRAKSIFIVNGYRTKDSWFSNSLFSQ